MDKCVFVKTLWLEINTCRRSPPEGDRDILVHLLLRQKRSCSGKTTYKYRCFKYGCFKDSETLCEINSRFRLHSNISWPLLSHRQSSGKRGAAAVGSLRCSQGVHRSHFCVCRSIFTLWQKSARTRCLSWITRGHWWARERPQGCLTWWWNPPRGTPAETKNNYWN